MLCHNPKQFVKQPRKSLGKRKASNIVLGSEETLQVLDEKSKARLNNQHTERRRMQGVFRRAKATQDREAHLESLFMSTVNNFSHQNLKSAYKVIQELRPKSIRSLTINKINGSSCFSDVETLDRWKEHFEAALNHLPAPSCPDLDIPTTPPPDQ